MRNVTFYHGLLKKYITLFGTLFSDVWVNRTDSSGGVKQSFRVPIVYSPREKLLARIDDIERNKDPLKQPYAMLFPRMGFEITAYSYASERKLGSTLKFARNDTETGNRRSMVYAPVPYDLTFTLTIASKNQEDAAMIVEQILPYFTPMWTPTVRLISDPEVVIDVPIILSDISSEDSYEGSFEQSRLLLWTLNFTMKAQFFGPVRNRPVINLTNTNIFPGLDGDPNPDVTFIWPGMTADGEPTTDPDLAVDRNLVNREDDWDYVVDDTKPSDP